MSAAHIHMSPDDFLVWSLDQPDRWELVNGVPIRMMTGATRIHDQVVVNLIVQLGTKLRGKPCRPNTADVASQMPNGNVRRPDVTIDCGGPPDTSLKSDQPTVFFEVLSPSTETFDRVRKPEEYKSVPSLRHIVLIDPRRPRVWLWTRSGDGVWRDQDILGLDAEISLTAIEVSLPMTSIYDGVELDPPTDSVSQRAL